MPLEEDPVRTRPCTAISSHRVSSSSGGASLYRRAPLEKEVQAVSLTLGFDVWVRTPSLADQTPGSTESPCTPVRQSTSSTSPKVSSTSKSFSCPRAAAGVGGGARRRRPHQLCRLAERNVGSARPPFPHPQLRPQGDGTHLLGEAAPLGLPRRPRRAMEPARRAAMSAPLPWTAAASIQLFQATTVARQCRSDPRSRPTAVWAQKSAGRKKFGGLTMRRGVGRPKLPNSPP